MGLLQTAIVILVQFSDIKGNVLLMQIAFAGKGPSFIALGLILADSLFNQIDLGLCQRPFTICGVGALGVAIRFGLAIPSQCGDFA